MLFGIFMSNLWAKELTDFFPIEAVALLLGTEVVFGFRKRWEISTTAH
jgi:hypothetical protein